MKMTSPGCFKTSKQSNESHPAVQKINIYRVDDRSSMNVKQRIVYQTMMMVFRVKYQMAPACMSRNLSYVGETHGYQMDAELDSTKDSKRSTAYRGKLRRKLT